MKPFYIESRSPDHFAAIIRYLVAIGYSAANGNPPEEFIQNFGHWKSVYIYGSRPEFGANPEQKEKYGRLDDAPIEFGPKPGDRPASLKVGKLYRVRGHGTSFLFRYKGVVGTCPYTLGRVVSMCHHKRVTIYVDEVDVFLASPSDVKEYFERE